MVPRMMLGASVLIAAGSWGCSLYLDFDRFEFDSSGGALEMDSSVLPEMAGDPGQDAPVRCPSGAPDCVDEGAPVSIRPDALDVDAGGLGSAPVRVDGGGGDPTPVPSSCAALKALDPDLSDGIYLIASDGTARRTYCDMTAQVALCSEGISDHDGVTRDSSRLAFTLTSVLEGSGCRVWNVRARQDGRPLDALVTAADGDVALPCTPLGFTSDPTLYVIESGCRYGQNAGSGTCGFNVTRPLRKWANLCSCELPGDINPGYFDHYVQQGTIYVSYIPWDASGTVSVLCGT